ncbi:IS110 family transposase [Bradyrhizobium sp. CB2312]|uniref:IS110 family transposase n=1 Tax=Bradyrhizobium sp. CB2312 TaxID=3039155 RepID=UPI0024B0B14E|nr:IS110 family transposase [Bradyrhizobium sp. CB2312]WFU74212.1 IS110 family transposase [Bradyrhizobium sp. CB2312]
MTPNEHPSQGTHKEINAIFVSVELSRKTWLITSLSPGAGEKLSRHTVTGGDVAGLLERLVGLRQKALKRTGRSYPVIVIQEAGLDGFWMHRVLEREGYESHVVDAASIATSRRMRRVKTDRLDGETLIRSLLAFKRGEPRVCSMLRVPSPVEEDRRRIVRERKVLMEERIRHSNRIKGLLFSQGITGYDPLRRDRREWLERLQTGDGRKLPDHMKRQLLRELDRLEVLLDQLKAVEAERNALLAEERQSAREVGLLSKVVGVGPEFAAVLWGEGLFRHFDNRRQVAAYAGLAPTPWQSGSIDREQGIGKSGNRRLRSTLLEMAWLWLRHQPGSTLSRWFNQRVAQNGGRFKKVMITALARKLIVALWKYVSAGVVIEGAVVRP